jgi:hypothetical protein
MGMYLIIFIRLPYFNYLNKDNIYTNFMESDRVTNEPAFEGMEL